MEISMREIQLTKGKVAIVDDADFEWLSQWKWQARLNINIWYAARDFRNNAGRLYKQYMHRLILGLEPGIKIDSDHVDGDGLHNWRGNLRIVTRQQNMFNHHPARGYYWSKQRRKWHARIGIDFGLINLGFFTEEKDAHTAYLVAKKKYHVIVPKTVQEALLGVGARLGSCNNRWSSSEDCYDRVVAERRASP
jgi:hypothetical protein